MPRAERRWTYRNFLSLLRRVAVWLSALLCALPLLAIISAFALPSESWEHLFETQLWLYVRNTLSLMISVGALSLLIGVSTAWWVSTCNFPGRNVLSWLLVLPLASPGYIIAYVYTDLLEVSGPVQSFLRDIFRVEGVQAMLPNIRSLPGAALMLALVLYPYVYLLARTSFTQQSRSEFQIAQSLGLSPAQAFRRVALPGARPAIIAGVALIMMETMADFGVADYFAIPTFSTGIFRTWLSMGDKIAALQLSGVMLIFVFILLVIEARSRRGHVQSRGQLAGQAYLFQPKGLTAWAISAACLIPIFLGFVLPVSILGYYALSAGDGRGLIAVMGFALNSLWVAGLSAMACLAVAMLLVYQKRHMRLALAQTSAAARGQAWLIRLITLGYALPGALLAVGLLGPLGGIDRDLTGFLREHTVYSGGLILSGTVIVLVYAMVVRFLTVAFNTLDSAYEKLSGGLEQAAQTLGASPLAIVARVHLPIMTPAFASALMLVIIDVIRELPATLILRPFNFETLATRVYWLASDERLSEASTAAIMIVMIGILPVIWLNRRN